MAVVVLDTHNLEVSVEKIEGLLNEGKTGVFIEVTNQKVISEFLKYTSVVFIDPQHTRVGFIEKVEDNTSAVKWTLVNYQRLLPSLYLDDVFYILEKVDMDALACLCVCKWVEEMGSDFSIPSDVEQRLEDINAVDCFVVPTEWNPDYISEYEIKWTNILGAAISDFKVPIEKRIKIMEDYLVNGSLPEEYRSQVEAEWQLLQQATVEEISGVTVVTSQARGASGLIYKQAPFGITYSENFNGKGEKFSVMQFKNGYLRLHSKPAVIDEEGNVIKEAELGFFDYMNNKYPEESGTWGGSPNAGGSPIPCKLSKELVANELAKFVL